jgi:hypothetical protein
MDSATWELVSRRSPTVPGGHTSVLNDPQRLLNVKSISNTREMTVYSYPSPDLSDGGTVSSVAIGGLARETFGGGAS